MFIKETYPTRSGYKNLIYTFKSQGDKGTISKVVVFQPKEEGSYNVAFGDEGNKGKINDKIVSNNNDLVKVISTVAFIIHDFFNNYPDAKISIGGVDERRLKLYNVIFKRHYKSLIQKFEINDFIDGTKEKYNSDKFYNKFEIIINKYLYQENSSTMIEEEAVAYGQNIEVTDEELNRIVEYVIKNQPIFPEQYYASQRTMLVENAIELFEKSPNLPLKEVLLMQMKRLPDFLPAENLVEVTKIITTTWEELRQKVTA